MKKLFTTALLSFGMMFTLLGQGWTNLNYPHSTYSFSSTYFINSDTGFISGNYYNQAQELYGGVFRTTNGGVSWSNPSSLEWDCNSTNIYFVNPSLGYIGDCGSISSTKNKGVSWNIVNYSIGENLCFTDASTGYSVGWGGLIQKTTDSVKTWQNQVSGTKQILRSVFFTSINNGFAVGDSGIILNTVNAGVTWAKQISGTTDSLRAVFFTDNNNGLAVGTNGVILITNTGGATWNKVTSGTSNQLNSVYFINSLIGYAAGNAGTILKTSNGGASWTLQTSGTSNNLYSVHFSGTTGYVVGSGGTVLKTTQDITTGLETINTQAKATIFPNPASENFTLQISSPVATNATISVTNIVGQLVLTENANLITGQNYIPFSASYLLNGIYTVQITSNSLQSSTSLLIQR